MSNVLLTGGAGNLGRRVAVRLAADGHSVRILDLPEKSDAVVWEVANIQTVSGDLCDREFLHVACSGIDQAVHLAAIIPPLSEDNRLLTQRVNIEGTRMLLQALAPGVPVIFASSVATYGNSRGPIVGVDHPQTPNDYYGETKLQNEQDIRRSGRPHAILRFSGLSVPALLEIPRPWFFTRDQQLEYLHLEDAATALCSCVDNPQVLGRTLLIAGGESWRMRGDDYAKAVCRSLDFPPEKATFQPEPIWSGWYDTDRSQKMLGYQEHSFDQFIAEIRRLYHEAIGAS